MSDSEPFIDCPHCEYTGDSWEFDPLEPGTPDRCPECEGKIEVDL